MPKRYRQLQVKDLPKVPTWRLEQDSNPWPSLKGIDSTNAPPHSTIQYNTIQYKKYNKNNFMFPDLAWTALMIRSETLAYFHLLASNSWFQFSLFGCRVACCSAYIWKHSFVQPMKLSMLLISASHVDNALSHSSFELSILIPDEESFFPSNLKDTHN